MDECIHWPKPYLLSSATCDEILSWMIEIWMKSHLVGDSKLQHCKSITPPNNYKEWQTMLGEHLISVGDTILQFTISVEQDN